MWRLLVAVFANVYIQKLYSTINFILEHKVQFASASFLNLCNKVIVSCEGQLIPRDDSTSFIEDSYK